MSRSALWRQEAKRDERDREARDIFESAVEEGRNNRSRGLIPLYGSDESFNINPMLLESVKKSPYFLKCYNELKDWTSLVDEIYYQVNHMEPWSAAASGAGGTYSKNNKMASTAFCLLVRLFTLRCTEKQMKLMLHHVDSPYIRCIGFLYLRYACDPKHLWDWFQPFVHDEEPVRIKANSCAAASEITMGHYVQGLLTDNDYFKTRLPRLPIHVERDITEKLQFADRVEERAKKHLGNKTNMDYFQKLGNRIRALYSDEDNPVSWYDALVDRVITQDENTGAPLSRPKFFVTFCEYGNSETVTLGEIDLPGGSKDDKDPWSSRGRQQQHSFAGYNRGYNGGGRREDVNHDQRREYNNDNNRNGGGRSYGYNKHSSRYVRNQSSRSRSRERYLDGSRAASGRPPPTAHSLSDPAGAHSSSSSSSSKRQNFVELDSSVRREPQSLPPPPPERKMTREELEATREKKRKLLAKYG